MIKNDFSGESCDDKNRAISEWPLGQDSIERQDEVPSQVRTRQSASVVHGAGVPHPVDVDVGPQLKKLRGHRQLSQQALAGKLGLTFQQIQKYEGGKNRLSASRMYEIGAHLDVSPAYFFEGLDPGLKTIISGDRRSWSEDKTPYHLNNDFMTSTESIRMMAAFYRINDANVRLSLKTLIYRVAESCRANIENSEKPSS